MSAVYEQRTEPPASDAAAAQTDEAGDAPSRPTIYLHGGQVHATAERVAVSTVLGSCVSVCLYDPGAQVGGMNHFLLPRVGGREASPRFGDVAMPVLLELVLDRGASRDRLRAKIFGGACVLEAFRAGGQSLGDENSELARSFLDSERIPIEARDTGGARGRKLVFLVDRGSATVRLL